jgi:hypothetical protein
MAKGGNLRVLKNGAVYGPFDRDVLEQMLASGRIGPDDQLSVRGGPWLTIAEFLAQPPDATAPAASPPRAAPLTAPKKQGSLRVLRGNRIVGSLDRGQVEQLHAARRLGDDDLICAAGGPWMLVGDFLAPTSRRPEAAATAVMAPSSPSVPAPRGGHVLTARPALDQPPIIESPSARQPLASPPIAYPAADYRPTAQPPMAQPLIAQPPIAYPAIDNPPTAYPPVAYPPTAFPPVAYPPVAYPPTAQPAIADPPIADPPTAYPPIAYPPIAQPPTVYPPIAYPSAAYPLSGPLPVAEPVTEDSEWDAPDGMALTTGIRPDLFAELDEPVLADEWFVRVRGIHSAPLKKQHVRMLFESREITLDTAARHCSWRETDWRPIREIAQLSNIAR